MKTVVVIPTYNEAENIQSICARVRLALPDADLLIVDDNSPDRTGDLVEAMGDSAIQLLRRERKEGLGPAYCAGFTWALLNRFERIVQMDADGSHPVDRLGDLLAASQGADVVLGSRYVLGGGVENWPRHRLLLSRLGNLYVQFALGLGIHDATSGFRVYSASALKQIGLEEIEANGYGFQINMTWRAKQCGLRLTEVPIIFTDRTRGKSKMNSRIVLEALMLTAKWALRSRAASLFPPKNR